MNYTETLRYLEKLERIGIKLGLENIERLLSISGNPQRSLRFIHIAGTNGKGSTASFIAEILRAAGYRVGLYTSPHLERFEERIKINGACISEERLADLTTYYRELIRGEDGFSPTYFEVTTAVAFKYFSEGAVDICVIEAGLGGRLDATNVIEPEVCVITGISRDHVQYLGHRLSDIAMEKFSIIKPDASVVAYIRQGPLREKLRDICLKGKNLLMVVDEDIEYNLIEANLNGQVFVLKERGNEILPPFRIKLLGRHQLINAGLAFGAVRMLSIELGHIRKGLEETVWPGRFEVVGTKPYILLDGAHNLEAIKRLKEALIDFFPHKKLILILAIMADKDWPGIIKTIAPLASRAIACGMNTERACRAAAIAREAKKYNNNVAECSCIKEALTLALDMAKEEDVICITGSLYLVGEAKRDLRNLRIGIPS